MKKKLEKPLKRENLKKLAQLKAVILGMEKDFGKRVVGSPYTQWGGKAEGLPPTHNQSQPALPI